MKGEQLETLMPVRTSDPETADVDLQVSTAKRYPRSIDKFKQQALRLATEDKDIAAKCIYGLPRSENGQKKIISGPSVRLAEIVATAWGNIRARADITGEDETFVYGVGTCWDLESNTAIQVKGRRRITGKRGRYNDDMIGVTSMALTSIVLRNAIFKVIPQAYVKQIYEACRKVAAGDEKTLPERRKAALQHIQSKYQVSAERVLAALGKHAVDDIDLEDLADLRGILNAIEEKEITVEDSFPMAETLKAGTFGFGKNKAARAQPAETKEPEPEKKPEPPKAAEEKKPEPPRAKAAQKFSVCPNCEGALKYSSLTDEYECATCGMQFNGEGECIGANNDVTPPAADEEQEQEAPPAEAEPKCANCGGELKQVKNRPGSFICSKCMLFSDGKGGAA